MTKTFLLGLGCQKGGTTWLYRYLTSSRQFVPGYRKEYHLFDSLYLESGEEARRRLLTVAAKHAANPQPENPRAAGSVHRLCMFLDPEYYSTTSRGCSTGARRAAGGRRDAGVRHAPTGRGEADPGGLRRTGITTLPVFLMRDPVERIWSHMRMLARVHPEHEAARTDSAEFVLAQYAHPATRAGPPTTRPSGHSTASSVPTRSTTASTSGSSPTPRSGGCAISPESTSSNPVSTSATTSRPRPMPSPRTPSGPSPSTTAGSTAPWPSGSRKCLWQTCGRAAGSCSEAGGLRRRAPRRRPRRRPGR